MFCLCSFQVQHFKDFIPQAFPNVADLILDCEVLLFDTKNRKPLPFGTLGFHKVSESPFHGINFVFLVS